MSRYQNIKTAASVNFSNGVEIITGTNSPEGVVSAVIGSKYLDAANGVEYLKTSGSGNTGWEENVIVSDIANKQDRVRVDKTIVNQIENYTIPTIDIDNFQSFFINQTTAGVLFQLGTPTGNIKKDIVIANIGSVSLQLFDTQRVIVQPNTITSTVFNGTSWSIQATANTLPYTQTFNATTDWGTASGGLYTITIPVATHGKAPSPTNIQVFELIGSDYQQIFPVIKINASGSVLIQVPEVPDSRFEGKISINF